MQKSCFVKNDHFDHYKTDLKMKMAIGPREWVPGGMGPEKWVPGGWVPGDGSQGMGPRGWVPRPKKKRCVFKKFSIKIHTKAVFLSKRPLSPYLSF